MEKKSKIAQITNIRLKRIILTFLFISPQDVTLIQIFQTIIRHKPYSYAHFEQF